MAITLITGPANAGKARIVLDAVRRHIAHGGLPLLVVPTSADSRHYLRELAGDGAALGARVERFDGLVEEVAARAGLSEPPLGRFARERVLAVLAARGAGVPAPGVQRALGGVIAELQVRRVTPARLRDAFARWVGSEGGSESQLPDLYEAYQAALAGLGRLDSEQRAMRALDRLRRRPALWGDQPLLVYGFDDLTPLQLDVIETLGAVVGAPVTIALTYEPGRVAFAGRAATFNALAPLAAEHRTLAPRAEHYAPASRAALSQLERSLFEVDAGRVHPDGVVRMLEGGGERAELELVAAEAVRLIDEGIAAEEVAVVVRASPERAQLLEEVFLTAGVPFAMPRRGPFANTAVGSGLIGLLRCAGSSAQRDADAGDLLAWLRTPGLLDRPELADRLEIAIRRTGASSAEQARTLWEEHNWPLEAIDRLREAAARPGRAGTVALIDRAGRELQRLFSAPRRGAAALLSWAEADEARALAAGRRALAELRELAAGDADLAPAGPGELADALSRLELDIGERPGPGRVAVLEPLALRARRVRALFLCGLQEGLFPAPPRPQAFLAEEERRALARNAGLILGEPLDALAAERYLLYAVVSRPEELLYLSWHLADDDGEPAARSLFVEDVCDLFTEELELGRERRPLGALPAPERASASPGAGGLAALGDERVLTALRARPWSASSLETWISCPARWFIERMLRPAELDAEPEPLARGGLAHAALRDVLERLREATGSARVTPARLGRARELLGASLDEHERRRPLSVAPERVRAARRRLQADLERYLEHLAEEGSTLEPRFLELGFGFDTDEQPGGDGPNALPALALAPGVSLRGRIDRIDVSESGQAVVYDYKNRSAPGPGRWIADGNLQLALYMRAAEELLGVTAAGGFYQPLSGEDLRPRGLLDVDSGVELECVRGDPRGRQEMDELLAEVLELARSAAAQATDGALPSRPDSCGYRGSGCAYPSICRCER